MSQMPTDNDDKRSVAASDFVQPDHPDEVPAQEAQQQHEQHEQPQFGLHQNPLDSRMDTGSTSNYEQELKEAKLTIAKLEAKNQALQAKVENLELTAQNHAKENADQKANYQAQINSLAQKLKEAEQRAQMGKNEQEEMDGSGNQASGSNQQRKVDYTWGQLQTKNMILAIPRGIVWDGSKTGASISACGLKATGTTTNRKKEKEQCVFATEGYAISGEQCRKDNCQYSGTIVFYYEVTTTGIFDVYSFGFTDGRPPTNTWTGGSPNSYGITAFGTDIHGCWLAGKEQDEMECQNPGIHPGDIVGCGILLNPKNDVAVFFTRNGILIVKPTPITPMVDRLYPTISIEGTYSVEANFGDNLAVKPFNWDIDKCPGLVFE